MDDLFYTLVFYLKIDARQNTREWVHLYVTKTDFLLLAVFRPYSENVFHKSSVTLS